MKNVHVFVPVFLYAVTKLIFQIKRIILSEKGCNCVVTLIFENTKNWGWSDDGKWRKKEDGLIRFLSISSLTKIIITLMFCTYV